MEKELQDFIEICNITNQSDVTLISFGDAIKQILINTGGIQRGLIKQIIVYFQRKKLIFDEIVSPYYEIATRIDYAADNTKNFRPFSDMKEWKQLIIATKKQIAEDPVAGTRYHGARISIVAKNIKSFIAKGLKVKISLGGISFDPHDKIIHKEVSEIEKDIQNIGARKLLDKIFKCQQYNATLSRYIVNRNLYQGKKRASIPFGFLINLCLKNITYTGIKMSESNLEMLVRDCFQKARTLLSIYDVESYIYFEDIFLSKEKLFEALFNYAFFDSNFCFLQENPSLAIEIALGIFENVPQKIFLETFHLNIQETKQILQYIFEQPSLGCLIFSAKKIASILSLPYEQVRRFITAFSHNILEINKEFDTPTAFDKVDFMFKPFIKLTEDEFVLVNKFLCAANIYEAFLLNLRNNRQICIDDKTGGYIEKFIYKKLHKKKISFHEGEFSDGEADLIIRDRRRIFCCEFKKKAFTRASKSGQPLEVLVDLIGSLLNSQIQANKVQEVLMKSGKICLDAKDCIFYRKERIYKISLSASNFGSFHDDCFVMNFLHILLETRLQADTNDANVIKKCKNFNKAVDAFVKQIQSFSVGEKQPNEVIRQDLFTRRFLPLSFFIFVLGKSKNNESFITQIMKNKNISTGNMDIWQTYIGWNR